MIVYLIEVLTKDKAIVFGRSDCPFSMSILIDKLRIQYFDNKDGEFDAEELEFLLRSLPKLKTSELVDFRMTTAVGFWFF